MNKLIFGINVTIDGCGDHAKGLPNEEVHEYFTGLTRECETLLYGRKTYELMVPFWPEIASQPNLQTKSLKDFANAFVAVPQIVVFSKTLPTANDKKTKIFRADLRAEVMRLKQEGAGDILTGGVDLPSQLLADGLVDEMHLVVHPVVAGKGRRLFDGLDLPNQLALKLVGTKVFKSGHAALHYAK